MRKGIAAMSVMAFLVVAGVAFIITWIALGPGDDGPSGAASDLSFKPFTLEEVLHNKTEVDLETSGKRIHSDRFDEIARRTSEIRGLPIKEEIVLVEASEALVKYQLLVTSLEDESLEETETDEKLLKALGLLEPEESLADIFTAVLTEQIAGSYDPETKEITIVAGKGLSGAYDEITMSHEVTHALQDQHFGLEKAPLENDDYDSDQNTSVLSLVEGDATDTMYEYAKDYMTVNDLMEMQEEADKMESPELDSAPMYLRRGLLFPYQEGYEFVQAIKEKAGGEQAVNDALRDPPLSTRQVMDPVEYLDGRYPPLDVALPDVTASLGKGWEKIDEDTLGEWDFEVWFEQFTTEATGKDVGGGWTGNTIQYYQGPGKSYVMPNQTVWETEADARAFFEYYPKLLEGRFSRKLSKTGETATSYEYKAAGVTFYCGMSGTTTLALQSTDESKLDAALESYPQMAPVP